MRRIIAILGIFASVWVGSMGKTVTVKVSSPGGLASELGEEILTADSLAVSGSINADDLATIRDYVTNGTLHTVDLGNTVIENDEIPKGCFKGARTLRSIVLPEGLTHIGDQAFEYCRIKFVRIPSTLTELGRATFNMTEGLHFENLVIPEGIETLPESCFFCAYGIERVTLPANLRKIEDYCFFQNMIQEVTIPGSVEEIGEGAFANNPIEKVTCLCNLPPYLGLEPFDFPEDITVTIPYGSKEAYMMDTSWSKFKLIESENPSSITDCTHTRAMLTANACNGSIIISAGEDSANPYNYQVLSPSGALAAQGSFRSAVTIADLPGGLYIIKAGDTVFKVII